MTASRDQPVGAVQTRRAGSGPAALTTTCSTARSARGDRARLSFQRLPLCSASLTPIRVQAYKSVQVSLLMLLYLRHLSACTSRALAGPHSRAQMPSRARDRKRLRRRAPPFGATGCVVPGRGTLITDAARSVRRRPRTPGTCCRGPHRTWPEMPGDRRIRLRPGPQRESTACAARSCLGWFAGVTRRRPIRPGCFTRRRAAGRNAGPCIRRKPGSGEPQRFPTPNPALSLRNVYYAKSNRRLVCPSDPGFRELPYGGKMRRPSGDQTNGIGVDAPKAARVTHRLPAVVPRSERRSRTRVLLRSTGRAALQAALWSREGVGGLWRASGALERGGIWLWRGSNAIRRGLRWKSPRNGPVQSVRRNATDRPVWSPAVAG